MRNDYESNYLAHHGILGMKWGQRNGPPYPLSAKMHSAAEKAAGWRKSLAEKSEAKKKKKRQAQALQKAREARAENIRKEKEKKAYEEDKQKALKSGKASDILKYKGDLTNKELQDAVSRLDWEKKLSDLSEREVKTGWDTMDAIMKKADKITDYVNSSSRLYTAITNALKPFKKKEDNDEEQKKKRNEAIQEVIDSRDKKLIKRYAPIMTNKELSNALAGLKSQDAYDEMFKSEKQKKKEEKAKQKAAAEEKDREALAKQAGERVSEMSKAANGNWEFSDYYDDDEPPKSNSKSSSSANRNFTMYNLEADLNEVDDDEVKEIEKLLRKKGLI